jgi:hypothetical protein
LACPWNEKSPPHQQANWTIPEIVRFTANDWNSLDEPTFNAIFAASPLRDAGFAKLKSNIAECNCKQP